MEVPTFIRNYQAVIDHFGYWPSFHDANVMSYTGPAPGRDTVDLVVHTWEMTPEVDSKGYYVLRKHVLITFRFTGVHHASLDDFDSGNILFGMAITRPESDVSIRVELDSVMDMSGAFSAESAEIVSVVPATASGVAH
jgi:hypothetical protein